MPGLSLEWRAAGTALAPAERWARALAAAHGDIASTRRTLYQDDACRLGWDAHARYPIETREDDRAFVCLEGRVYDPSQPPAADRLLAAARELGEGQEDGARQLRALAEGWEGEYIAIIVLKRERRMWVFGDPLGRLPLYGRQEPQSLLLSRDQRFVLDLGEGAGVDRLGVAQLLVFGFPLGRRTLALGVERLTAGEVVCAARDGIRRWIGPYEPANLEHKERAGLSAAQNADELAERFIHGCRMRAAACAPPLLSLSGGLDSRAVAAGLAVAGAAFRAYTFLDAAGASAHEVPAAREVARVLGAPWRTIDAPHPDGRALMRMLEMKTGLNSLAMSYSIPVFEALRADEGEALTLWSGDGGDKVLPDHRPRLGRGDLVRYLIEHRPLWPPAMVAALTGVAEHELCASVAETIERYPERGADQRFVRFGLVERGGRWIFEGEDCNRHYFWTVAPFYDRGFYRAALACPDDQKSGHRLYRYFLRYLDRDMTEIPDANLGRAMDDPRYAWLRRLREVGRRFPRLRRWAGRGVPGSVLQPPPALMGAVLRRQLERSGAVRSGFSRAALTAVADAPERWGDAALDGLLTATSAVERIGGDASTLEEFAARRFA